jgi:hypothetical protein
VAESFFNFTAKATTSAIAKKHREPWPTVNFDKTGRTRRIAGRTSGSLAADV